MTAAQVREVITRLIEAGHWRDGNPPVLVIFDAGYDPMRLAYQLADLPVEILGRLAVTGCCTSPSRPASPAPTAGRPATAGSSRFGPAAWPEPAVTTTTATTRYSAAVAQAWDRLHPRLTHRSAWIGHGGPLPVIEGTLIRLRVDQGALDDGQRAAVPDPGGAVRQPGVQPVPGLRHGGAVAGGRRGRGHGRFWPRGGVRKRELPAVAGPRPLVPGWRAGTGKCSTRSLRNRPGSPRAGPRADKPAASGHTPRRRSPGPAGHRRASAPPRSAG